MRKSLIALFSISLVLLSGCSYTQKSDESLISGLNNLGTQSENLVQENEEEKNEIEENLIGISDDKKTFSEFINSNGEKVYYQNREIIGADLQTFQSIDDYFSRDKNSVYYFENKIPNLDPTTFKKVNDEYIKDKNSYYAEMLGTYSELNGEDIDTFEVLGGVYARDKNNIRAVNSILKEADYITFKVINNASEPDILGESATTYDAQDKNNKYLLGKVVK